MQREERFAISKPPPIFYGVLSILLIFVLVMAAIRYWPERPYPKTWDRRISVLHQLKGELDLIWSNLWLLLMTIFVTVFLPLLSLLVFYRKKRSGSPL